MFIDKKLITTNKSGFTLVELIVVISILAILGTIAFLSFGGYSASARDAKRSQNLDDIAKAMTIGQANGKSLASFVTDGVGKLGSGGLSGSSSLVNYYGGKINATALELKATDYQDPSSDDDYKIGVTTSAGGAFELAATMETLVNNSKATRVLGNFRSRSNTPVNSSTGSIIKIGDANIGIFKVGDYVQDSTATPVKTTITAISADGTTITLADAITTGTIALQNPEVAGLVADIADANVPVTDKSTTLFPYTVN